MCCLFGMMDYGNHFTATERTQVVMALAVASEERGIDATGIAYNSHGKMHVYKQPLPAHKMRFKIPSEASVVMGHTRMKTQGSEKKNYNNHPFLGTVGNREFALAHNGVLWNTEETARKLSLPFTKIETDSYLAVQIIEHKKALNFATLKYMAEEVNGSFAFTVLDQNNDLYFVKGDNPLCIYHFPAENVYLYASTEGILARAIYSLGLPLKKAELVDVHDGDILRVTKSKGLTRTSFESDDFSHVRHYSWCSPCGSVRSRQQSLWDEQHMEELKAAAAALGYRPAVIDRALNLGFSRNEVEEMLYSGGF